MKNFKLKTANIFIIAVIAITIFTFPASASTTDGTIDSTYKYGWGENIGWINFGTANGNIHITDSGMTGYALSETVGWINLANVVNDGEGHLSGYAWGENIGWIKFNPANGGVSINSLGEFTGSALSETVGWIIFNGDYKVKTDWRPQSARGGGGLPPEAYNPPTLPPSTPENPEGKFSVVINNGDKYANSQTVKLKLNAGSNTVKMAISNTIDFKNINQILYQKEIEWTLPSISNGEFLISNQTPNPNDQITNYKLQTVYVKFYTQYGVASEVISDSIILDTIPPEVKVSHIDSFLSNQDIIIAGFTELDTKIGIKLDNSFTNTPPVFADSTGYFSFNLGRLSVGSHTLDLKGTDLAGNTGETLSLNLIVKKPETTVSPEIKPIPSPTPKETPNLPETPTPTSSAQPPEQPSIPTPSKPAVEEPKTPPSSSEPSEPPMPAELVQPKSTKAITSKSSEQPSFAGSFWQSTKTTFKNIFSAITGSFSNAGKKIANLFNQGRNNFAVFLRDAKILGSEIKIAVFESQSPLQISDVKVISVSSTSVEVIWQTNHKATSKVNYGLTRIYDGEKQDSEKVKNHSVILTGLDPDTTYHYEVISQNGSYVYDADRIFATAEK